MPDANEPSDRYEKPGRGNDAQFAGLREEFLQFFGGDDADDNPHNDAPICVVRSPGRVNLIGEHTDYAEGFVFPMAIEPRVTFAYRRRNDGQIRVATDRDDSGVTTFTVDEGKGEPSWTNYLRGVVALLRERGEVVQGADVYLMSSLPVGAGLSSSAALEVGMCRAMLDLSGADLTEDEIAKLCQKAEHDYAGMPCGIMDQMAVTAGREGHAMMLDCRTLERTFVPLPVDDVAIVITDSKAEHALVDGEYKERRESAEAAAKQLGVSFLRDATPDQVESAKGDLGDQLYRRAKHITTENQRCLDFAEALKNGDYAKAGELMYASHASMKDDFEITTPTLDGLVEAARKVDGVYGSRMTGGGFGGCTVTLCKASAADAVQDALKAAAKEQFDVETIPFVTTAANGAKVVD